MVFVGQQERDSTIEASDNGWELNLTSLVDQFLPFATRASERSPK